MLGQKVIAAPGGRTVGRIIDVLFDDAGRRVTGVVVGALRRRTRVLVVPFQQVHAVTLDSVVVDLTAARRGACVDPPQNATGGTLEGKPVINGAGQVLGTLRDVLFDEHTGCVVGYELDTWAPRQICRRRALVYLAAPPVVGDVILVSAAPQPALAAHSVRRRARARVH